MNKKQKACKHLKREYYDHIVGWPEEIDGTDIRWEVSCSDCDLVLAEGDAYDSKKTIRDALTRLTENK